MVYRAPGKWAFFKRVEIGPPGDPYMIRWMLFACPLFRIYLHKICRSDAGRDFHDHPWNFISIVLWYGYAEWTETSRKWRGIGSIAFRRATDLHRVFVDYPAWTLVLAGRRLREWGFQTPEGWVHWKDYKGEA